MGSGASLPRAGDSGWFMALIDSERKEKQWLAKQYDSKCTEARALQAELEQLRRLLEGGAPEGAAAAAPSPVLSRPEFLQPGMQPAVVSWQLGPVEEHAVPRAAGQESPTSPTSPASPASSSKSLKERRGLHLSVDTREGQNRSPVPAPEPAQPALAQEPPPEEAQAADPLPDRSCTEPCKSLEAQAPPSARRGSLSALRPPSLLREDRIQRRSLGNLGDVEALQALAKDANPSLNIQAEKIQVLDAPVSPKRLKLTSQNTWNAENSSASAA